MFDHSDSEHEDSWSESDGENSPDIGSLMSMLTWHGIEDEVVLSNEQQVPLADQFALKFFKRYPSSELLFSRVSLEQTIQNSLRHPQTPAPLILYIHHDQAIAANVFCEQLFHSEVLVPYLNDGFSVWPWDRTHTNNYHHLLKLIDTQFGHEAALQVASYAGSIDSYPLLVCLGSRNGRFEITNIIEGTTPLDQVFNTLLDMNNDFHAGLNPMSQSLYPSWYRLSESKAGERLENLTQQLHTFVGHLIDIRDRENKIVELAELLPATQPEEKVLIFGCNRSLAATLMKDGFPTDIEYAIDVHGRARATSLQADQPAVLICRVHSRNPIWDKDFVTYDSTATQRTFFLNLRGQNIIPQYLITYRD